MRTKKILKNIVLTISIGAIFVYLGLHIVAFFMPALKINGSHGLYFYDSNNNLFTGTTKEWISVNNISPEEVLRVSLYTFL